MKLSQKQLRRLIESALDVQGDRSVMQKPPHTLQAGDKFIIPLASGDVSIDITKVVVSGFGRSTDPYVRIYYTYDGAGVGQGESSVNTRDFPLLWDDESDYSK